ncbi:MAG: thioredoxin family protein [Elusimicrobia bacterium]|nr:thioredoxin family protein [Elusimicrobiota bacterium]
MKKIYLLAILCIPAAPQYARSTAAPKIYDETADASVQVAAAVRRASAGRKRVLLDFGANWCGDCQALDRLLRRPENQVLLRADYELVHVDIGRFDKNVALAARLGVPIKKGVPALAVLDGRGEVVYAQKNGEFEAMRSLDPTAVSVFLRKWRTPKKDAAHAKN